MTEYIIKEVGLHQWILFADRESIALCTTENEAENLMMEDSARRRVLLNNRLVRTRLHQRAVTGPRFARPPAGQDPTEGVCRERLLARREHR